MTQKSILQRVADLLRNSDQATSAEVLEVHRSLAARIEAIDLERKTAELELNRATDVETAERAQSTLNRLAAELRIALRRRSEVHEELKAARGRDAMQAAPA